MEFNIKILLLGMILLLIFGCTEINKLTTKDCGEVPVIVGTNECFKDALYSCTPAKISSTITMRTDNGTMKMTQTIIEKTGELCKVKTEYFPKGAYNYDDTLCYYDSKGKLTDCTLV